MLFELDRQKDLRKPLETFPSLPLRSARTPSRAGSTACSRMRGFDSPERDVRRTVPIQSRIALQAACQTPQMWQKARRRTVCDIDIESPQRKPDPIV